MLRLKRAYEPPSSDDGQRILVERLWPRGLTKSRAKIDLWLKDIAPSADLRKWYAHDVAKWKQFQSRYRKELRNNPEQVAVLRRKAKEGVVTLIYAARDEEHNGAVVLMDYLNGKKPVVGSGHAEKLYRLFLGRPLVSLGVSRPVGEHQPQPGTFGLVAIHYDVRWSGLVVAAPVEEAMDCHFEGVLISTIRRHF
jgi:uncharacterized protein YeaO (DUF488 family)